MHGASGCAVVGLYVRGVPLITLHESKPFANVARMTDRTRDTDGAPTSTPLARWLDSVVPALFASDAALSRAAGVPQANVSRWRRGTTGTRRANGQSTLSDPPNRRGYYDAKVWMGTKTDGRPDRRHIARKSRPAVRRAVRELERKRDAGIAGKPGRVPTVEQMLTRHLDVVLTQRGRAPRTVDDYWSKCRNDIFPRWGGQRIDRLLPEQIEDGYAEMIRAGHAASHVRKVHAILSSAYEEQVKRGNVARNPCRLVEPPALRHFTACFEPV